MNRRRQHWCANSWMQLRCPQLVKGSSVNLNRTVVTSIQTQSRPSSFPACAIELQFSCGIIWNAKTARSSRSTLLCPPAPPAKSGRLVFGPEDWWICRAQLDAAHSEHHRQRTRSLVDCGRISQPNMVELERTRGDCDHVSGFSPRRRRQSQKRWDPAVPVVSESHRQEQNPHARGFRLDLN